MQVTDSAPVPARRGRTRASWVVILAVIAAGCVDLAARQMVRASLLGWPRDARVYPVLAAVLVAAAAGMLLARRRGNADRVVALGLAAALAAGLTAQMELGARLQSDGFYYFAHMRSLWFDGDQDLANDYRLLGMGDKPQLFQLTKTGHAQSAWTIGPALAWAPFFGGAHLVARALPADRQVKTDGTSYPYRQAVCIASLFYGLLGAWFCYRLASLYFSRGVSAAATAVTIAGSFMLWYLVKEPTMTHALSMCGVAAFAYGWARTGQARSLAGWAGLGLLAGFVATIRWQNALFALLPAAEAAGLLISALRHGDKAGARRVLVAGAMFTAAAVIGFAPQMLAWKAIYGAYFAVSPLGPQIRPMHPQLLDTLWSSRNGLLTTSPVLYMSVLGLLPFVRSRARAGVPMAIAIAAMIYFNASIQDWWGSAAVGARRFDGILPLLVVGCAAFIVAARRIVERRPGLVVAGLLAAGVLWNVTFMRAALASVFVPGDPIDLGRLTGYQAETLHTWFGHPFSDPLNLAYAARNGVSPARAEVLRARRFLTEPLRPWATIDVGGDDGDFLGSGWWDPEQDGPLKYRWAQQEATLIVPLDHAEMLDVQLNAQPFTFAQAPAQAITVEINGVAHGPMAMRPGWQIVQLWTSASEWSSGLNEVRLRFSRGSRPVDVGVGNDSRTLSAAIDYVRIRKVER